MKQPIQRIRAIKRSQMQFRWGNIGLMKMCGIVIGRGTNGVRRKMHGLGHVREEGKKVVMVWWGEMVFDSHQLATLAFMTAFISAVNAPTFLVFHFTFNSLNELNYHAISN